MSAPPSLGCGCDDEDDDDDVVFFCWLPRVIIQMSKEEWWEVGAEAMIFTTHFESTKYHKILVD